MPQTQQTIDDCGSFYGSLQAARLRVASAITLAGIQNLQGDTGAAGHRVLVEGQGVATDNGVYVMAAGAWDRSLDAEVGDDVGAMLIGVTDGDHAQELRRVSGRVGEGVVGTDAIATELQVSPGGGPTTDYKVAVSFFRSNADHLEDNSGVWRSYAKIIFEGSDNITPPTSAKLILWTKDAGDDVSFRLRNITDGIDLVNQTFSPGNSPIITVFSLANIPTTEVILELQLMQVGNSSYMLASFNLATN